MLRVAAVDAENYLKNYVSDRSRFQNVMISHVADSLEGVLAQGAADVDAAVVHSPMDQYGAAIRLAAKYEKHVLVYGFIGLSPREIRDGVRACEKAGVVLQVARPLRSAPYQQAAYASLANGDLGELGLVRIHSWKQPIASETNPLFLIVSEIDVACWLFGDWPASVYAMSVNGRANNMQVHLGFAGGGMAIIDCNDAATATAATYFSLSLVGSKGATYADDHRNVNLVVGPERIAAEAPGQGMDCVWQYLNEFAVNVAANATDDGTECLRAVSVTKAAYLSIKSNDVLKREGIQYVC